MSQTSVNRRQFIHRLGHGALGLMGTSALLEPRAAWAEAAGGKKLNFVFILIDDLGWRDVGCYGTDFYETPHIDRLAAQGMKFTNAYAACPVCSPTRASILTGRYPARLHLTDWIAGHKRPYGKLRVPKFNQQLPLLEVTQAEALEPAGYVSASIGKWHLGDKPFHPDKQGFELNFAGTRWGAPRSYFHPYKEWTCDRRRPEEYLTDRLTDEAGDFIQQNKDRPFYLYLSHFAVHTPLQAKQKLIAKYKAKLARSDLKLDPAMAKKRTTYAAMIQSVDESVGRIMAKLDELKLADRTVVFFMSDNGGLAWVTSNAPLRAGKGTMYEGGIREPMIVRWPGVVKPRSTCDVPVTSTDFYPTILEMAGLKPDPNRVLDGVSLVPLLKRTGTIRRDALYWHYPHYHPCGATPSGAIRKGDLKLIERYEDGRLELYNLKDDLSEKHDLAAEMPPKAAELRKMLADWRKAVNAQMPTPNPNYDPTKETKGAWWRKKKPKTNK